MIEGFAEDRGFHRAWLELSYAEEEITCEATMEAAALRLLDCDPSGSAARDWPSWVDDFDLIAAGLSTIQAFRAPLKVEKCSFAGGDPVPDCVEVPLTPTPPHCSAHC